MSENYRPVFWTEDSPTVDPLVLGETGEGEVHWRLNSLLREYQREGVRFTWDRISRGGGGILADDMGLGKLLLIMITSCCHLIFMYFILTRQDCPSHRSPFGSLQEERRPGGQTEDPPDQDG